MRDMLILTLEFPKIDKSKRQGEEVDLPKAKKAKIDNHQVTKRSLGSSDMTNNDFKVIKTNDQV